MTEPLQRLIRLLENLLQLDLADLDFGVYRLFRLREAEIRAFLQEQLPRAVEEAFAEVTATDRAQLERTLHEQARKARDLIASDTILPNGEPNPKYSGIKALDDYQATRRAVAATDAVEHLQTEVFNWLYSFFARYYDDGDFIPRRFFGGRPVYAVPYQGEEVLLYWANQGQYYVKNGEVFRDYAFTVSTLAGDYTVRFTVDHATVATGDAKGKARLFFPRLENARFDAAARALEIPFEYRLPTEEEITRYGTNSRGQTAILEETEAAILQAVPDEFLRTALAASSSPKSGENPGQELSLLRRRLQHFTKKRTSDYFVHKDLAAFLQQELEFFIRDQVVHSLDIEGEVVAKRSALKVFRHLAQIFIEFLAEIENAQKRLFEKKKFVWRTDYLIPIGRVPRDLWREVLANPSQCAEWQNLLASTADAGLFNTTGEITEETLLKHPTLIVDTRHFLDRFKDRLLESIENLDEWTDGVLIHADNFQALGLMQERYAGQIQCIYIDPPYNTDASPIDYKNGYKSSTWITMIYDRIQVAKSLLTSDGVLVSAIDDEQYRELHFILSQIFNGQILGTISVRSNPSGRPQSTGYSVSHDYMIFAGNGPEAAIGRMPPTEEQLARFSQHDEIGLFEWRNLRREGSNSDRAARPKLYYPIYLNGSTMRVPPMEWDDDHKEWVVLEEPAPEEQVVWPINDRGEQKTWRWESKTVINRLDEISVRPDRQGRNYPYYKRRPHEEGVVCMSTWVDAKYSAVEHGTGLLKSLFGRSPFSYPKSLYTVADAMYVAGAAKPRATVLDFYAGSGTTGHAVISLNRRDGGRRKFLLVEVADYFDTVLVPRIKKVMFAPEWKDGRPTRLPTAKEVERTPRLVKLLRLESYEDTLRNTFSELTLERLGDRERAFHALVGDNAYRLRYLVRLPLDASASMLNLAQLEHPFDYTLEIMGDYGPRSETGDLIETFNWLYGLRDQRRLTWVNAADPTPREADGRRYRVVVASDRDARKRILVVWRDMTGLAPDVERQFLEAHVAALGGFDEQWINGDTAAKGFASLDGLFKRLMEGHGR